MQRGQQKFSAVYRLIGERGCVSPHMDRGRPISARSPYPEWHILQPLGDSPVISTRQVFPAYLMSRNTTSSVLHVQLLYPNYFQSLKGHTISNHSSFEKKCRCFIAQIADFCFFNLVYVWGSIGKQLNNKFTHLTIVGSSETPWYNTDMKPRSVKREFISNILANKLEEMLLLICRRVSFMHDRILLNFNHILPNPLSENYREICKFRTGSVPWPTCWPDFNHFRFSMGANRTIRNLVWKVRK